MGEENLCLGLRERGPTEELSRRRQGRGQRSLSTAIMIVCTDSVFDLLRLLRQVQEIPFTPTSEPSAYISAEFRRHSRRM